MNISNNISSLQANQKLMDTTANNVANVNTVGFIPSDTRVSSLGDGVVAKNIKVDDNGMKNSQTNLVKEIPNMMVAEKATAVNISAIKTQDEMLGSLLDIKA